MIIWLFDRKNQHGFLPNLVKDETLQPDTQEWWDLCIKPPYSYEFRFLKYCKLDRVPQNCTLVNDYITGTASAYYPININFFDPEIDYIQLMDLNSLARLKQGDFKLLFYYSEGDRAEEITTSLERMCREHNINMNNIKFVTANYKLNKVAPFIYFPDDELYYRYLHILDNQFVKAQNMQKRNKKFTCLIRADKLWRRIYASFLFQLDLIKEGYFSYTGYKYETSHQGLDDLTMWNDYDDTLVTDNLAFEMHMPFRCDELSDIEHNDHKRINHDYFQDAYWNFVVETHFDDETIFLTEKTFKPILNLQPFIIVGNPGSLELLHKLGYKTFSEVIKEDYDQELDHRERMSTLLKISFDITALTDKHHKRIQQIISDALHHNQQHFLAPKVNRINGLLRQLEYA